MTLAGQNNTDSNKNYQPVIRLRFPRQGNRINFDFVRFFIFLLATISINSFGSDVIFQGKFYDKENWLKSFNKTMPPWIEGKKRCKVTFDSHRKNHVLEVIFPKNQVGNSKTGAQWITYLNKSYEKLKLSYWVKVGKNFNFVKGGKLPGLIGGHKKGQRHSTATGGYMPDGTDGWSARIMWRKDGKLVQYVYHKNKPGKWGEDFPWTINSKPAKLSPGVWHKLTTEVRMNKIGERNGSIVSYLDNQKALEVKNIEFRSVKDIAIDAMYFSTFFGGEGHDWATTKDETIRFDSFRIKKI